MTLTQLQAASAFSCANAMSDYQHLQQRTYVKGLNASTSILDQPKGTVPKLSNMMLSIRGALRSIFGGSIVASYQGNAIQNNPIAGAIKKVFQGISNVRNRAYYLLQDTFLTLTPTYSLAATPSAGGTLPAARTMPARSRS